MELRTRDKLTTVADVAPWFVALAAVVGVAFPMVSGSIGEGSTTAARPSAVAAVVVTGSVPVATDPYQPGQSLPDGLHEVTEKVVQVDRTAPTNRAAKVVIVGDSLTVGASPGLQDLLTDVNLRIDAKVGRAMPDGTRAATSSRASAADIVVIALGSNDSCEVTECKRRVSSILAVVNPNAPVVWMLPAEFRPNMENVRTAVNAVVGIRPRSIVLDWQPYQDDHPEIVLSDRIHLTTAGYRLRAEVTANQVHALLAR
jgi:lysophospholipase L1-like esterase